MADFIADSGREKPLLRDIDKKQEHKPETVDKPLFSEDGAFQGVSGGSSSKGKPPQPKVYLPEGAKVISDKTERIGDDLVRKVDYKMESSEPASKMTRKCPGCGTLIKSNWSLCMPCRKKEYLEFFEEKIIPLLQEQDRIYTKDMKEAIGKPQSYMDRFTKYMVEKKLLLEHWEKSNRRNFTLPRKYREDLSVTKNKEWGCIYCGKKVRENNFVCTDCRPQWIKDVFSLLLPLLEDKKPHIVDELWEAMGKKYSKVTCYRLLNDMEGKGWLIPGKKGQKKTYRLGKHYPGQRKKDPAKKEEPVFEDIKVKLPEINLNPFFDYIRECEEAMHQLCERMRNYLLYGMPDPEAIITRDQLANKPEKTFRQELREYIIDNLKQTSEKGEPVTYHLHLLVLLELEEGIHNQSLGDGQSTTMERQDALFNTLARILIKRSRYQYYY